MPAHNLKVFKSSGYLLQSFCGPRPIRTPSPGAVKKRTAPKITLPKPVVPSTRPVRSARQAAQPKRYKEKHSDLSDLSDLEAKAIILPGSASKRQKTRSRSSSGVSVSSVVQFQQLAEFANSITLETWLNNQSAGLGTACANVLKQHGLHSHSQLIRFTQPEWFVEFMDKKVVGKGIDQANEALLKTIVVQALS